MADEKEPDGESTQSKAWKVFHLQMANTDEQLARLRRIAGSVDTKAEAAILTMCSNRELAGATMTAAETIFAGMNHATTLVDIKAQQLGLKLDTLNARIDTFTTKADEGTNRLATWTKYLAIATAVLALATIGLVVVEWLKPEPQFVVTPAPPTTRTPPVISAPPNR